MNIRKYLTKEQILTIPNVLSLFRLLLIPLMIYLYVAEERPYAALAVVAVSGLTDIADGYIARHFNMVSDVGKVLDPIADKLTQAALLICLASRYRVIYWVFALLCVKETLQTFFGYAAIRATGEVLGARWYGKVSTGVFYGVMILLMLFPELPETWAYILIGLCAAALAMALVLYVRYYLSIVWEHLFPGQSRGAVWLNILLIVLWAAVIVLCWLHRDAVTVDGILRITPQNMVLAVLLMLGLFALKSLSVIVYCGILYAASGLLFPLPLAVTVNLAGTAVMSIIPYAFGRRLDSGVFDRAVSGHKNAAILRNLRMENTFLYTLLIRIVNIFPFDIMSAYFGATETPLGPYVLGSVAGMATSCVLFPILGTNITNPGSPQFIVSAVIELVVIAASFVALRVVRKKAGVSRES